MNLCKKHNTPLRTQSCIKDGKLEVISGICDDCLNEPQVKEPQAKEPQLHAHCQIQYPFRNHMGELTLRESLIAFDPIGERQIIHDVLDEYLDKYIIPSMERAEKGERQSEVDFPRLSLENVRSLLSSYYWPSDKWGHKDAIDALEKMREAYEKHEAFFRVFSLVDKH